jgi:TolB-like protein/Tfp pilus assembly protein PilF
VQAVSLHVVARPFEGKNASSQLALPKMKRCPACNRLESDDALVFCRADGTALVSDSSSLDSDAGTARLGSGSVATEIETSILPHTTDAAMSRGTAPTTVLPAQPPSSTTRDLTKPKRRRVLIAGVLLIAAVFTVAAYFYLAKKDKAAIQSIAVMPFVNESGNADAEYLSDGMTETLISSLSQLPNLNVKARSSVFRYKGKDTNPQTIGKELNVQAILSGRVVQRGDQLTLNLELIDAQTENVIWSESYNRKQADLVSLQSEIARDVSSKLKIKLSGADQQKLTKTYTTDPEAYRLYLQGRFYLNKRVGKEFEKAEDYFQRAIAIDSNLALGYVGLAEFLGERDRPKAKEYIMRALAIDNQLSDAHASLGYQLMLDYDFAASEREFRRAIELDPNNARAYQWNGSRLTMIGLYDQALTSFDRAIEIEPTLADIRNNRGGCLVASGRIDDGIAEIKKSMELDPTFPWTHSHISFVYRMKGDRAASVEERARAFELLDRADQARRMRERFAASGWTGYLREIVSQDWGKLGTSRTRRASLLAELGEKEAAIASLNDAAAKGDYWLFSIKYDPAFEPLRGDPRFQELLKKFNPPR